MIRTDLPTIETTRSGASARPSTDRWTCDDDSYWGIVAGADTGARPTRSRETARPAPVRRRPVVRDARRPHGGGIEYDGRTAGVSRAPHGSRPARGIASVVAVVLVTAASALGLVGVANLRAADVPPQPSVVEQLDLGVSPR